MAPLVREFPEHHGLSSKALSRFFDRVEQNKLQVNSFMLLQDGQVTAQMWRAPYRPNCPQLLYSLSKSVTSIAVGIAADNGYVHLDDPVNHFFPEQCPEHISENLEKMKIHHLLSMNTGHHSNIYNAVTGEKDWVRSFLSLEVECEPGSYYSYNTPATYMLSAIIQQATGQQLVDFLMPRLFEPLGIDRPVWETCPMGIVAGGMGLSLTTEGVAKFGQMLLDKGKYEGKTIVSEAYMALATREQSDNRQGAKRIDWAQGYGYQFHLCRKGCFRGDGSNGQLCFVAPEQRIVIAATSAFPHMDQLQTFLDLIYEHIIDELDSSQTVLPLTADSVALRQLLADMAYPVPVARPIPDNAADLDGRLYRIGDNPEKLHKLGFARIGERLEVRFCYEESENRVLEFDFRSPVHVHDSHVKDLAIHRQEAVTYAAWHDNMTLKLTLLYIETPYCVSYTLHFTAGGIKLHFHKNVSMTFREYQVTGHQIK
ncbi:serine hydrolase domain-containing protein [Paenibacillus hodogayensis]|uniref:Serine hydrolase domain-containing protein n=1 Tax=Paenibacillus hodogayensis TaxID=279208 RepID=A0ABV5VUC6_9BACL